MGRRTVAVGWCDPNGSIWVNYDRLHFDGPEESDVELRIFPKPGPKLRPSGRPARTEPYTIDELTTEPTIAPELDGNVVPIPTKEA